MILNAKINLMKVKGVSYSPEMKLQNGHSFLIVDIDESGVVIDNFGAHLSVDIIEKNDKEKSWGFIKERSRKGADLEERKAMPIIGSVWQAASHDGQQDTQQKQYRKAPHVNPFDQSMPF